MRIAFAVACAAALSAAAAPARPVMPPMDAAAITKACQTGLADARATIAMGIKYGRQWLYAAFDIELCSRAPRPALEVWKESEVLALDMLSAFKGNLLDAGAGRRYRDTILAQGGQEEPQKLVRRFLGREPDSKAFFEEITGKR
jgi:thimet oligopeptidase